MKKKYMIWWHSYVDEISREATTIKEVSESVSNTLQKLNELKDLEEQGKIKVKDTGAINPLFIEILDEKVEPKVAQNPIVDVEDVDDSNYFQ
jgi:hypothetical protein